MQKKSKQTKRHFTLLEVIVAMAILAVGLVASLALCASANSRMGKAEQSWRVQHMLSQGAEYFLIMGPKSAITEEFFPYPGHLISCTVDTPAELPSGVSDRSGNWRLATLRIELKGPDGKLLAELPVDKIFMGDDL